MKKIVQTSRTESDETHRLDTAVMLLTDDGDLSTAPTAQDSRARFTFISEKKRKQVIPSSKPGSRVGVFMDCRLF